MHYRGRHEPNSNHFPVVRWYMGHTFWLLPARNADFVLLQIKALNAEAQEQQARQLGLLKRAFRKRFPTLKPESTT
jgi:hypothetical protein